MVGATNKAKNGAGLWNFDNDFAKNVVIFGVNNSSSFHTDNCKNNFLELGKSSTLVLMDFLVQKKIGLVLSLIKQGQNLGWIYITM